MPTHTYTHAHVDSEVLGMDILAVLVLLLSTIGHPSIHPSISHCHCFPFSRILPSVVLVRIGAGLPTTTMSHTNPHGTNRPTHSQPASPAQMSLMGGHELSVEEIQDLLGGVLDDEHNHHHPLVSLTHAGLSEATDSTAAAASLASHQQSHHALSYQRLQLQHYLTHSHSNPLLNSARSDDGNDDNNDATDAAAPSSSSRARPHALDGKAVARSERKRSREKQRRSDVNQQFTALTTVLREIESTCDDVHARALPAFSPSNRADLIARVIGCLEALHGAVKRRKAENESLETQLQQAKQAGEETAAKLKESLMAPQSFGQNRVMMMVPMMIGANGPEAIPQGTVPPQMANMMSYMTAPPHAYMTAPQPTLPQQQPSQSVPSHGTPANESNSAPPAAAPGTGNSSNAFPFVMPPYFMPSAPTPADAQSASSASTTDSRKASPVGATEVGSNLAHCA